MKTIENAITIGKGIAGSVAIETVPLVVESLPTVQEVQTGIGLISQIIVLIATLVALFKRKKKNEDNE